jgi:hypothetical protein
LRWAKSFDEAAQQARDLKQVFMVLFTSRSQAETAGEGPAVFKEYVDTNGKLPELTLVDEKHAIESIMLKNVRIFAKLADTHANRELFKKYGAEPSTVVLIAPDGEKLASYKGADCSPEKFKPFLAKFDSMYSDWKRRSGL